MTSDPFSSTPAPLQDDSDASAPDSPDATPQADNDTDDSVQIPMEDFPDSMPIKVGSKLTFCVTAEADDNGQVTGYFMDKDDEKGDGKESSNWDDEFRQAMSPRNPNPEQPI